MSTYSHGRHEHGQNFLTNSRVIASLLERVASTTGPLIEIGPGEGALTRPLAGTGRPLTAVEIDSRLAEALRRSLGPAVTIVNLHIRRRTTRLVPMKKRRAFQALVHTAYTGRGRGIVEIITRAKILPSRQAALARAERSGVRPAALPSDLSVAQMVSLFESSGAAPPRRRRWKKVRT